MSRNPLQRRQQIRVRAVQVRQVKHADPPVVRPADERLEFRFPHPRRVRLAIPAVDSGAKTEAAHFQTGLAQRDGLVGVEMRRLGFGGPLELDAG